MDLPSEGMPVVPTGISDCGREPATAGLGAWTASSSPWLHGGRGGEGVSAISSRIVPMGEGVFCVFTNAAHAETDLVVEQKIQGNLHAGIQPIFGGAVGFQDSRIPLTRDTLT